jgi:HK97 family phage major capsid protein
MLTAEQRQKLIKRGADLHRVALKENRQLTDNEQSELVQLEKQIDENEYAEKHGDAQRRFTSSVELRNRRELRPGEIRVYQPKERLSDDKPWDGPGLGMYIRGIALGKWDGAQELRTLAEGSLGGGGYLVPTPLSLSLIDILRNQARVIQAGAVTIPMDSATLKMARLSSDVTSYWKAENAAMTESDNVFQEIVFTSHTLTSLTKISVELLEDSAPAVDGIVSESIAKSMALGLDYAALYGDGLGNNPIGIKNQTGVVLTPVNATDEVMPSWMPFSTSVSTLMGNNVPGPFQAIYSARTAGELDRLVDTLGQPLRKPPLVEEIDMFVSNQIPNTLTEGSPAVSTCSDIFVGQFNECLIGMRTSLAMEVSRVAADSSGSAFSNLQVWIRAYLRADVQLRHPAAFNVITGVL